LFRRIARTHRTLWVNTVGLRPPRLQREDARRIVTKLASWRRARPRGEDEGLDLHVIAPPMLPWMRPRPLRALNRASVRRSLRSAAHAHGIASPVLVVTVPNGIDAAGVLGERLLVYYCVDDFTLWPGVDHTAAVALEAELLARADIVIATSEHLSRTRARAGKPTYVLPHGVDVAHLSRASARETVPLPGVRAGRPVVGYLGLIDGRTDADLVAGVARARRDWDLVLVGPIDQVPRALRAEPNVRTVPAVPYARVPEALAAFDVAILPYARNELTASINPLKLREYLASGRPVVATPLPEVVRFEPHVRLAATVSAFVREVGAALAGPRDLRAERVSLLRDESWEARVEQFLSLCDGADAGRSERAVRGVHQEAV
jgi:glycosyltransferase involved in cell wall biosynthesis